MTTYSVDIAKSPNTNQIILTASYNVAVEFNLIEYLRTIEKRYWDSIKKKWFLPMSQFENVYMHLKSLKIKVYLCEVLFEAQKNIVSNMAQKSNKQNDSDEESNKNSDSEPISDIPVSTQLINKPPVAIAKYTELDETVTNLRKKSAVKRKAAKDNNKALSEEGNQYLGSKNKLHDITNTIVDDNKRFKTDIIEVECSLEESDEEDLPIKRESIRVKYEKSNLNKKK
jgi:hypothetical protein